VAEKTRRIVALQQRQREIQTRLHQGMVGREVEVLIDSRSRRRAEELSGRSTGNIVVNFPVPQPPQPAEDTASAWIGRLVSVRITRAGAHSLWGEAVASRRAG
jgi:tRNA-2-methylthio-N6-dimethylallyladenosine synthase